MNLSERLIPAIIAVLLLGILVPLCAAAGLDGCGDSCCELTAARAVSAGWAKTITSLVAALGAAGLAIGGQLGLRRFGSVATPHIASPYALSAVPLRI
jgi:hypothetical protein